MALKWQVQSKKGTEFGKEKYLRQDLEQGEEGKAELVSQEAKMLRDLGRAGAEQREGGERGHTNPVITFNFFCLFSSLGMGS